MAVVRIRQSRSRLRHADIALVIGILGGAVLAVLVAVPFMLALQQDYTEAVANLNAVHSAEVSAMTEQHQTDISSLVETNQELSTEADILNEQLTVLATAGPDDQSVVNLALAQKYLYVIREAPVGKGVTLELLAYTDQLCREKNVNPHLVWAMVQHESRFMADATNPRTDARGLGQFIPRTGRAIYEDYLCLGTYSHQLAYDPYINIQMMVEYLRDINTRQSNNRDVLDEYGGYTAGQYYNEIAAYMNNVGTDPTITTYN